MGIISLMPITRDNVRSYYDQNTELFLAFGNSQQALNIHRALWTDGAKTHDEALNVSSQRILAEIETVAASHARIADLGCGVGASLFQIFPSLKAPRYAVGITISGLQARLATKSAKRLNLGDQVLFTESDFACVPLASRSLDALFSVEAIAHASEPQLVFQESSRLLRTGGRLILLDDYRAARTLAPAEIDWLNAFIRGWHVPGVITVETAQDFAAASDLQLVRNTDFTPFLRLRNLPEVLARSLRFLGNSLPIRHAILPSMLGSMALQQCLYQNIIQYRFLVFEKRSALDSHH
jgi:SAM-dependent methyltransferase